MLIFYFLFLLSQLYFYPTVVEILIVKEKCNIFFLCSSVLPSLLLCMCVKSLQLCPTLWDPLDCSPPGFSVHGIIQARILECVAVPSSMGIFPTQGPNPHLLHLLHCKQILFFLIFLFIFFICSGFCHTLKWKSHGFTCVPHPDPPSHLPLHPLPLGFPSAPGPLSHLWNLHNFFKRSQNKTKPNKFL